MKRFTEKEIKLLAVCGCCSYRAPDAMPACGGMRRGSYPNSSVRFACRAVQSPEPMAAGTIGTPTRGFGGWHPPSILVRIGINVRNEECAKEGTNGEILCGVD